MEHSTKTERRDEAVLLELPDTALVREAAEVMGTVLPEYLYRHSLRAFLLGRAWGRKHSKLFDEEGLYLAALFHDAGLAEDYRDGSRAFTENSCACMNTFLREQNEVDADLPRRLNDAILYHMRYFPAWSKGNEAGLLQIGAWMDVAGRRRADILKEARIISRTYSRAGMQDFQKTLLGSFGSFRSCARLIFPPRPGVAA